jgi:hypothetical protein
MTTGLMLDDVNLTIEEKHVADARVIAIAGYVNGRYANWPAIVAKYGRSGKHLLSIDVQAVPAAGAQCLDVEYGDAKVSQSGGWAKETRAAGVAAKDLRYYPKLYTSESDLQAVVDNCTKAGLKRDEYMLWSAHYGKGAHICGPKTCGSPVQADATQYTDKYDGVSLDATLAYAYFFAGAPKPAPVPVGPPKPVQVKVPNVVGMTHNDAARALDAAGFRTVAPEVPPGDSSKVTSQKPVADALADKGATVTLEVKLIPPKPVVPPPPPPPPVVTKVAAFVRTDYPKATTVEVPAGAILFVLKEFNV